jgi:hypothetical protein
VPTAAALFVAFEVGENLEPVLRLIEKYHDVPISLADDCLVPIVKPSLTPSSCRLTRISVVAVATPARRFLV